MSKKRERHRSSKTEQAQRVRLVHKDTGITLDAKKLPESRILWVSDIGPEDGVALEESFQAALSRIELPYPSFELVSPDLRELIDKGIDLHTEDGKRTLEMGIESATLRNFERLFEFYGIEADGRHCWKLLALVLAIRHVAGFSSLSPSWKSVKAGAPEKWTIFHEILFYAWVAWRRRVNNKAGVLQICGSIPKPLRTQLPGESDETLRRKFQALRKDDRLKQYDEAQCAAFGADWIKRLGEGELTFDPKAPFTHGLPSIMPTGKVEG